MIAVLLALAWLVASVVVVAVFRGALWQSSRDWRPPRESLARDRRVAFRR